MIYDVDVEVTAGTTEAAPVKIDLKVWRGVIHQFDLVFPSGCAGLVYTRLMHGSHPVIPSNADQKLSGDGIQISGKEFYDLKDETNTLTIYAWSPNASYDHTITWRLYVLDDKYLLPVGATEGILESLKTLVLRPIVIQQTAEGT